MPLGTVRCCSRRGGFDLIRLDRGGPDAIRASAATAPRLQRLEPDQRAGHVPRTDARDRTRADEPMPE